MRYNGAVDTERFSPEMESFPTQRPFTEFVIKIHESCNLACNYCYMYEMADQSWRTRNYAMSRETITQAAKRIGEHVGQYDAPGASIVLHGGEPLLAGAETIAFAAETFRERVPDSVPLYLRMQTNGTLLDEPMLDLLSAYNIRVGVSLDGYKETNDTRRIYRNGRGSYDAAIAGLNLLRSPKYKEIYAGILCTIDVNSDAIRTFDTLKSFDPPAVDFLLPHANWQTGPPAATNTTSRTPYGDWLSAVYDRWAAGKAADYSRVRLFESIYARFLNKPSTTELIGFGNSMMMVIESDGAIEQVDALKSAFEGAAATGLNVFEHSLDQAFAHPGITARELGLAALSQTCQECKLVNVCGGGMYVHRYHPRNGFDNPSVYCYDLAKLIVHINQDLAKRFLTN